MVQHAAVPPSAGGSLNYCRERNGDDVRIRRNTEEPSATEQHRETASENAPSSANPGQQPSAPPAALSPTDLRINQQQLSKRDVRPPKGSRYDRLFAAVFKAYAPSDNRCSPEILIIWPARMQKAAEDIYGRAALILAAIGLISHRFRYRVRSRYTQLFNEAAAGIITDSTFITPRLKYPAPK
jgi:hypothetical protein